jgi:hypothetical protein
MSITINAGTNTKNVVLVPITGTLTGVITDSLSGAAIQGATVTLGGNTTTTNASGAYSFTGIPVGSYPFSVSAPGYVTQNF